MMTETTHDVARATRFSYMVSILCVLAATLARLILHPVVGTSFPFATYFLAVMFMAWYGGLGPSLVALALGLLAASSFFIWQQSGLPVMNKENITGLVLYLVVGAGMAVLGESMHRAARRAQQNSAEILRGRELLSATITSIGDAIITTDIEGRVTFLNPVAESLTGWARKEAAGRPLDDVFKIANEQTRATVESPVTKILRDGAVIGLANHTILIAKDGREIPIDDSGAPIKRDADGSIAGVILVFRDVTERKRNEDAMRASEERFSKAFHASPQAMSISRFADRRFIDANEGFLRATGYSREEWLGRNGAEMGIWPTDEDRARVPRLEGDRTSLRNVECRLRLKSGEIHLFSLSAEVIDIGGEKCVLSVIDDITERKRTELVLRDKEDRLRMALESAALGTWDYNPLTETLAWDDACKAMFNLPPGAEVNNDIFFAELHPEDRDRVRQSIERALDPATGGIYDAEYRVIGLGEGAERWVAARGQAFFDEAGQAVRFIVTVLDITARKRAEEQIKATLNEKELLLREVHHRVKNNLQVIASLLRMQSRSIGDGRVLEIFKESQNRVTSIAFVHEQLYRAEGIEQIELGKYIHSLAGHLYVSYGAETSGVKLIIKAENVSLDVDTAIPCGLIINELVSNALKYAFQGERKGQINIIFGLSGEAEFTLVVSDDGIGIGKDFDPSNSSSLGLRIVNSLVDQLKGRMEVRGEKGTEFKVTFKAMRYQKRV